MLNEIRTLNSVRSSMMIESRSHNFSDSQLGMPMGIHGHG